MKTFETMLLSWPTLVFVLNLAVVGGLVCLVGLIASMACRKSSAPLQHGVLVCVAVLVLVSPLLVLLGQQRGIGLIQPILVMNESSVSSSHDTFEETSGRLDRGWESRDVIPLEVNTEPIPTGLMSRTASVEQPRVESTEVESIEAESNEAAEVVSSVGYTSRTMWWQCLGTLLAFAWIMGIAIGFVRFTQGMRLVMELRRSLDAPEDTRLHAFALFATRRLGLDGTPSVWLSPFAPLPMVLGFFRPVIVLPSTAMETMSDEQLKAVLLHEAAHIARRDHWIGLIQQAAQTLFWWNPLMKRMNERICDLREDICDNHVLSEQGNGVGLARILVETAARSMPHRALPSMIGVLSPRIDRLSGRVMRLVDKNRNTTTRLAPTSRWVLALVLAVGMVGITCVGGFRVARADASAKGQTMLLHVVDEKGDPISGAKLQCRTYSLERTPPSETIEHISDARGEVVVALPEDEQLMNLAISVFAEHLVPVAMMWGGCMHEKKEAIPTEFTVRLKRGIEIGGTVRDTNGQPIQGVSVTLQSYRTSSPRQRVFSRLEKVVVKTDKQGKWRYDGVPKEWRTVDGLLQLLMTHKNYVRKTAYCDSHDLQARRLFSMEDVVELEKGYPIRGKVTDPNGNPIAGVKVVFEFNGPNHLVPSDVVRTDANGRYQLFGCQREKGKMRVSALGWTTQTHTPVITGEPIDFQLNKCGLLVLETVDEQGTPLRNVSVMRPQSPCFSNSDPENPFQFTDANGQWRTNDEPDEPDDPYFLDMPRTHDEPQESNVLNMPRTHVKPDGVKVTLSRFGFQQAHVTLKSKKSPNRVVLKRLRPRKEAERIPGMVLSPEGKPVKGAQIQPHVDKYSNDLICNGRFANDGAGDPISISDGKGQFLMTIPEKYGKDYSVVAISKVGYAIMPRKQFLASHKITLLPWGRVEGVLSVGGQPAAMCKINLQPTFDSNHPVSQRPLFFSDALTDENGKFLMKYVQPGSARISWKSLPHNGEHRPPSEMTDVTVTGGKTVKVRIDSKKPAAD